MTTTTDHPTTRATTGVPPTAPRATARRHARDGARPPGARGAAPRLRSAALLLGGLHAGFFVTYAISVTTGLALVDDRTYVATFQAINEAVRTPVFMVVFAAPLPLAAALAALQRGRARAVALVAALAFATVVAVTFAGNVPLNEQLALAGVTPDIASTARAAFEEPWNRFNLVRTIAAVVGFTGLALGASRPTPVTR